MSYLTVGGLAVSIGTSLFGASAAREEADKQRDLMWKIKLLEISTKEKTDFEAIRTTQETDRIKILTDSLEKYRESLQKESTIRLRDTWIYIAGLGCGTSALYAISLMYSKSSSNGNG